MTSGCYIPDNTGIPTRQAACLEAAPAEGDHEGGEFITDENTNPSKGAASSSADEVSSESGAAMIESNGMSVDAAALPPQGTGDAAATKNASAMLDRPLTPSELGISSQILALPLPRPDGAPGGPAPLPDGPVPVMESSGMTEWPPVP